MIVSAAGNMRNLEEGCDTVVWLLLQDADKLQPGGFYLDRRPAPKHLWGGGTSYSRDKVDQLWAKLTQMMAAADQSAAGSAATGQK